MIKYLSIIAVILFLYLLFASTVHAKENNGLTIIRDELKAQGLTESEVEVMMDLIACESNFDPYAQNPVSSSAGLLQINYSTWLANSDYDWELRYDWLANIETGVKIFRARGVSPWAQCL